MTRGWGPSWMVARSLLRRSWLVTAAVVLLASVTGTSVLASLDGARRTRSAVPDLLAETRFPDLFAMVEPGPDGRGDHEALGVIADEPGIDAVAPAAVMFMVPADGDLPPGRETKFFVTVGTDARLGTDVLAPRLVAGRRADPTRADEVVIGERAARELGVSVGDTVRFLSVTPGQAAEAEATGTDPGLPAGPEVDLRVVGVGRTLWDLQAGESLDDLPLLGTPALHAQRRTEIASQEGLVLGRLRPGADPEAIAESVRAELGDRASLLGAGEGGHGSIDQVIETEHAALVAFAGVVGLAGLLTIALALARQHWVAATDVVVLQAMGMRQTAWLVVGALAAAPIAIATAALSVLGAVAVSPLLPIGLAGRVDESGFTGHPLLLGAGAGVIVLTVLALGAGTAWRVARAQLRPATSLRGSWLVGQTRLLGASPPVTTGVRMALEPGRGPTAVPIRPALAAAIVGVAGVAGAAVVAASLDRLIDTPARYGWTWDVTVAAGSDSDAAADVADRLRGLPAVDAVTLASAGSVEVDGRPVWGVGLHGHEVRPTVVDGRAPEAADEVALGRATLQRTGRSLGETVAVGPQGYERPLRIVGTVVMPPTENDEPASGALIAGDLTGFDPRCGDGGACHDVLVRLVAGTDLDQAVAELQDEGFSVTTDLRPIDVDTLAQIHRLPWVLAAVLAVVATLSLAHAVSAGTRRRGVDLAVLASLGFTPRQVARTVRCQALTMATIGLVVGLPLGLLVGSRAWAILARNLGMADDALRPATATLGAVLGTLLLALALAAVPGAKAAGRNPAALLAKSDDHPRRASLAP